MFIVHIQEIIKTAFTVDCETEEEAKDLVMQYLDGKFFSAIDQEDMYETTVEVLSVKEKPYEEEPDEPD
jgi:hypothetical protein